ncbi:pheromone-binding protein-related protein 6-like [Atheta coriaria]|uniref:pheromone-binding protein-related protein 6-like n=1 Tax=Dalotia coriaria TaxID=877792 RepID=UPI0031F3763C
MKFVVIFIIVQCLLIQYATAEFSAQKYKEMHDTCVNQSGCPEDIIENARNGDFNPDQRFKAFLKCCFEQEDGLDANGNILVDKVLESFHDDLVAKYEKPMRECNDIVSHAGDTLDYIYNYCYCAYEKTKEHFDIP